MQQRWREFYLDRIVAQRLDFGICCHWIAHDGESYDRGIARRVEQTEWLTMGVSYTSSDPQHRQLFGPIVADVQRSINGKATARF
jgi:hypothetical protein